MMPVIGMIEFRSCRVFVRFLFDIEVRMQVAAFFCCVRVKERLVHQPDQKAGDAVSHGYTAAHGGILKTGFWQVNPCHSEENVRISNQQQYTRRKRKAGG